MWPGMVKLTLTLSARIQTNSHQIGTGEVLGGGGAGSYGIDFPHCKFLVRPLASQLPGALICTSVM